MADRSTWVAGHGRPATHDGVVIGGGAAGLSAALVLGWGRQRVTVVAMPPPRGTRPRGTCRGSYPATGCHSLTPASSISVRRKNSSRRCVYLRGWLRRPSDQLAAWA